MDQFVLKVCKKFLKPNSPPSWVSNFGITNLTMGFLSHKLSIQKNLAKKFDLKNAKHFKNPMSTTLKLSEDEDGVSVDPTLYRSMIDSLLYLTTIRPDICYSVRVCPRYQSNPKEYHITSVKRIIRYVRTLDYGIWYSKDSNASLAGFSDVDWVGNADDRKSTSGGCFYLGNNIVSWHNKKQNPISLSTAETSYIAVGSCCT